MSLAVELITDEEGARAFHDVDAETTPFDHPGLVAEPLEAIVGMLPNPLPSFRVAFYLGRDAGAVVATAFLGLPMLENTHTSHLHVSVALDARRRGFGTQMATFLFDEARRAGRTMANWNTGSPLDAPSAGDAMSERLGATPALGSIRRELLLSKLDRAQLARQLEALRAGPCADYELRSWTGACPDDLVASAAKMVPIVMSDSPQGELDWDLEEWDTERYREYESMLSTRKRRSLSAAAMEKATGRMVALTDLNVGTVDHRVVSQMGTAVVPEHRGHRLGLAVKTANVLTLLDTYPDAETIQTVNASENEHMIAVNAALGFEAVERSTIWKLDL